VQETCSDYFQSLEVVDKAAERKNDLALKHIQDELQDSQTKAAYFFQSRIESNYKLVMPALKTIP